MGRRIGGFTRDSGGAVAPTIALSLFALIAAAGIAFDYARMASLDTELQTAADQAALAAATQLDGLAGACSRAATAAANMLAHKTLTANDDDPSGRNVTIPLEVDCDSVDNVRFWQNEDGTGVVDEDAEARFVEVTVDPREAFFFLTPIVNAMSSGELRATARAGMRSALCETPPVMICNPQETSGNTNFDLAAIEGKGLKLVSVGSGGSWAPGNFGYLDTGAGSNGAPGLREALGWEEAPGDCVAASGVNTKPGATVSVVDALNTRFDIYENVSCPAGGNCGAAINSVKDVARAANATGGNACRLHNNGWNQGTTTTAYGWGTIPSAATTALPTSTTPTVMGHPPDMCHSVPGSVSGACSGAIGDGAWDVDAYFRTNYVRGDGTRWSAAAWQANTPDMTRTGIGGRPKRYEVYIWEMAHRGEVVDGVQVLGARIASGSGASAFTSYGVPICSAAKGYGSGVVPTSTTPDRRLISVAVVNCTQNGVSGNSTDVPVKDWIDVFLVQPAINRGSVTNNGEIYVEVAGRTSNATDQGGVQVVKKSVPYLIE